MAHPRQKTGVLQSFPVSYGAGTLWMKRPDDGVSRETIEAVKTAIDLGYRHIDGAQYYETEPEMGIAIQESGIPRSELSVTTKTLNVDDVEQALKESLSKLQLDYVDLYLIHAPFFAKSKEHLQSAWRDMERCQQQGLARNIGVSSFTIEHMKWMLEIATIKPAMNQIEMHPYCQQPKLWAFLKEHSIAVQGFAALTPLTKIHDGPARKPCKMLAEKYGVSESAILLRWVVDQGASVVTTSGQRQRLSAYLTEVQKFQLSSEDIQSISEPSESQHFRGFFAEEFTAWEKSH